MGLPKIVCIRVPLTFSCGVHPTMTLLALCHETPSTSVSPCRGPVGSRLDILCTYVHFSRFRNTIKTLQESILGVRLQNPGNQPQKENTSTKRRKLPKQQEQSQPNQRQREKNQRNKGEDRDKQKNKREPKSVITHVKCFCQQVHDNVRG